MAQMAQMGRISKIENRHAKMGGRTGRKGSSGKNIIPGLKSAKYSVVGPRRILRGAFYFGFKVVL